MQSINDISIKYQTDKKDHDYIKLYDLYFAQYRDKKGRLLEIGVYKGESLKLWQEVFPYFKIEGLDITNVDIPFKIYIGNQTDRQLLNTLPSYDIIIDDGGHRSKEQIISLVSKIDNTKLYVIEDLHTSLPGLFQNFHDPGEITCLDYLTKYPNIKPDYISNEEHDKLKNRNIKIEHGVVSPIAFII